MRRLLFILALSASAFADPSVQQIIATANGLVTVTGGWAFLQGDSGSVNANGGAGFQIQASCGASQSATCTVQTMPTTAGSVRAIGLVDINNENITITSAYDCAASTCNSGNALDTATLCSTHGCQIQNSNDDIDVAYIVNGAANATHVTFNLSGTPASGAMYLEYMEEAPPNCNGSPCTTAFDANKTMHFASGACSTLCTDSAGMTLAGTDGIIGIIDSSNVVGSFNSPYFIDSIGNVLGLDATSAPALTVKTAGFLTLSNIAFKITGASYSPQANTFSNVWPTPGDGFQIRQTNCGPTCTAINWPGTTGTGHLLFLFVGQNSNNAVISSVSGGGTWVIPTGASTCQNTSVSTNPLSCAYVLSSTSGNTSITVTMNTSCTTCNFYMAEVSRSSGSFVLDSQNSSEVATATNPVAGQTLTLSGTIDACFAEVEWTSLSLFENAAKFYALPGGQNEFGAPGTPVGGGIASMLLNVRSYLTPSVFLNGSTTNSTTSEVCFK